MKMSYMIVIFLVVLFALFGLTFVKSDLSHFTGRYVDYTFDCDVCEDYDGVGTLDPYECSQDRPWWCYKEEVQDGYTCELVENCNVCGCPSGDYDCDIMSGACVPEPPDQEYTHSECVYFPDGDFYRCISAPGSGSSECNEDSDCYTAPGNGTTLWHYTCNSNGDCQVAMGPGRDECEEVGGYPPMLMCIEEYLNGCSDYVWDGECDLAQLPMYCEDGEFTNNCQICGCPQYSWGEQVCNPDGSCSYVSEENVDTLQNLNDLQKFKDLNFSLESEANTEDYFLYKILYSLQFKRYEKPIAIKFISPYLYEVTRNLPEKPDLVYENETIIEEVPEGVQPSPPRETIKITGLAALPEDVYLSPGDREQEFNIILEVVNGIPLINVEV